VRVVHLALNSLSDILDDVRGAIQHYNDLGFEFVGTSVAALLLPITTASVEFVGGYREKFAHMPKLWRTCVRPPTAPTLGLVRLAWNLTVDSPYSGAENSAEPHEWQNKIITGGLFPDAVIKFAILQLVDVAGFSGFVVVMKLHG
jgi:hypothetical protein